MPRAGMYHVRQQGSRRSRCPCTVTLCKAQHPQHAKRAVQPSKAVAAIQRLASAPNPHKPRTVFACSLPSRACVWAGAEMWTVAIIPCDLHRVSEWSQLSGLGSHVPVHQPDRPRVPVNGTSKGALTIGRTPFTKQNKSMMTACIWSPRFLPTRQQPTITTVSRSTTNTSSYNATMMPTVQHIPHRHVQVQCRRPLHPRQLVPTATTQSPLSISMHSQPQY